MTKANSTLSLHDRVLDLTYDPWEGVEKGVEEKKKKEELKEKTDEKVENEKNCSSRADKRRCRLAEEETDLEGGDDDDQGGMGKVGLVAIDRRNKKKPKKGEAEKY